MANNTPFLRGDKARESAEFSEKIKSRTGMVFCTFRVQIVGGKYLE